MYWYVFVGFWNVIKYKLCWLICRAVTTNSERLLTYVPPMFDDLQVDPLTHQVKICDFGSAKVLVCLPPSICQPVFCCCFFCQFGLLQSARLSDFSNAHSLRFLYFYISCLLIWCYYDNMIWTQLARRPIFWLFLLGGEGRGLKLFDLMFSWQTDFHQVKGEANISYICSRFYRAPELIFGATEYTNSIDIWSAGCVLSELMLGQVGNFMIRLEFQFLRIIYSTAALGLQLLQMKFNVVYSYSHCSLGKMQLTSLLK